MAYVPQPLAIPPPRDDDPKAAIERLPAFAPSAAALLVDARAFLDSGRDTLEALHREGASGRTVVRAMSELMDRLVRGLFDSTTRDAMPAPFVALAALGGYGRKELAPRSDLDLFLLHEDSGSPRREVAALAERLLYTLWDLKLEVGWGVRNSRECARLADEDHTARTALVDCRFLAGDPRIYQGLERAVLGDALTHHADAFIADKVLELRRRREKYGHSVYLLEPNVKQGEGGLRDLQSALWIARARFRSKGVADLLHLSILPPREVSELLSARDYLWRVRNELHYATGRKEDRLTFDLQVHVAAQMGYRESGDGLPVEQFMRHYYLAAKVIKRAADALVSRCEEQRRRAPPTERRLDHELKVWSGKLTLSDPELFARKPAAMLRLFAVADREGLPLLSFARDRVAHELHRVDASVRESPETGWTLVQMFSRPGTRGDFLPAMHDIGLLGAVFPEFGRVTALHQHDLYHVYTVDVHSIFAVRHLYALRNGELAEQEPSLTRLMQGLSRPLPLYLGTLFHDCGKGAGGDHSLVGARLMGNVSRRLSLSARDAGDAEFLVRAHLLMGHVSQRRDLTDPRMIASFAKECGDPDRLAMLYLLTYADMSSVAPSTWNDWRSRLLKELYDKSLSALVGGSAVDDAFAIRLAISQRRGTLGARTLAREVASFLASVPERYLRTVPPADAPRHARLLGLSRKGRMVAALVHRENHTELTVAAPDRPGLLSMLTGTLAAHRLDIVHAEIFSTTEGLALDIFSVRGRQGGKLERARWRAARTDLRAVVEGRLSVKALFDRRATRGIAGRFVPVAPTQIVFDNRSAEDATVIDVYTQDRLGLLHAISRVFFEHGVEISLAKIATEGNRAADAFYVRQGGRRIEDPVKLERLKEALRAELDP
jgi:[protein-PII] uridylyltransferase